MPPAQLMESRRIAACMLNFCGRHTDVVAPLFDLLSIFTVSRDAQGLSASFLTAHRRVANRFARSCQRRPSQTSGINVMATCDRLAATGLTSLSSDLNCGIHAGSDEDRLQLRDRLLQGDGRREIHAGPEERGADMH